MPGKFQLKEPKLNLVFERKDLETFYYLNDPYSKKIDVKDYSISNAEAIKSLYSEIENVVINHSESTLERKSIDYSLVLKNVVYGKDEANKIININLDEAINRYRDLIYDIDNNTRGLADRDIDGNKVLIELMDQKKKILSNLALCYLRKKNYKEAIQIDLHILSVDSKFEKSYLRLISCYTSLDNLDSANHYANTMKSIFGYGVVKKYPEYFNELERKNNLADESLRKLSKRSKKNSEMKSEIGDDEKNSKVSKENKPSSNWMALKLFFGFLALGSSSLFLAYLFNMRHKYQRK